MPYTGSKAQTGQQTTISVSAVVSPPTYTLIGEALSCTFSDKNMFDDTTNLESVAKEFLATLKDPGKLNVDLNRVSNDAGQTILSNSYYAAPPTRLPYLVTMPINTAAGQTTTGDTYSFLAYVETFAPDVKVDKKITTKFALQITGAITFVEGS